MLLKAINPFDQSTVCELPYDQGNALDQKVAAQTFF
jgi:hypothetical protein